MNAQGEGFFGKSLSSRKWILIPPPPPSSKGKEASDLYGRKGGEVRIVEEGIASIKQLSVEARGKRDLFALLLC